jgi:hypothetical protein
VPSNQRWTFFSTRIIYSDLVKIQGLINNKYFGQGKINELFYVDMQIIRSRSCIDNFVQFKQGLGS